MRVIVSVMARFVQFTLFVAVPLAPIGAHAAVAVDWVDFSPYSTGAISQSGLSSHDGLELTATFSTLTGFSDLSPQHIPVSLSESDWPSTTPVSSIYIIASGENEADTELSLTFTSSGGFPVGGGIAVIDLELVQSSVRVTGYFDGAAVSDNWHVTFYQTAGNNVAPPVFDPSTNTLTGTGESYPTENNFVYLMSDAQLDSIVLSVTAAPGDGILFAVANGPIATIPEPAALAIWGTLGSLGLIAIGRRRKAA